MGAVVGRWRDVMGADAQGKDDLDRGLPDRNLRWVSGSRTLGGELVVFTKAVAGPLAQAGLTPLGQL